MKKKEKIKKRKLKITCACLSVGKRKQNPPVIFIDVKVKD